MWLEGAAAAITSEFSITWGAERERFASARDDNLQVYVGRAQGLNCELLVFVGQTLDSRPRTRYRQDIAI
eukprot:4491316-Pleurochrysis_carterae.AAC.1